MRELEKWIWLSQEAYPKHQTTIYHMTAVSPDKKDEEGHFTVAEFKRSYRFEKKIVKARLRISGDTEFLLWVNEKLVADGPVNIGGDYAYNETCRNQHYASVLTLYPDTEELDFYARVRMMPVLMNEYSKGHGGFMLTGHLEFEDGTIGLVMTDRTWLGRRDTRYPRPYYYDGSKAPDNYLPAAEVPNIWYPETMKLPMRDRTLLYPRQEQGELLLQPGETKQVTFDYGKVYGGYLHVRAQVKGKVHLRIRLFEREEVVSEEELIFMGESTYLGEWLHSVGGFCVEAENESDDVAKLQVGVLATCYPAPECAQVKTSDEELNKVLSLCRQALKYCRQRMHLDSPKHSEPLACTGDYYVETLMTLFSFGDMSLAKADVLRTAELLRYNDGRMFHTTYSCIWPMMAYDTYMMTGDCEMLSDCRDALYLLLNRFQSYMGENGLIEHPVDYMFVDWLEIDGYTLHHPPKNLGQSVLNMFYYGALVYGASIYEVLGLHAMQEDCKKKAEALKTAINTRLYKKEKGLYTEGLTTLTPEEELNFWLPQSNGREYFRKHANILAAYFGICDKETARRLLRRVVNDNSLGECQPYFQHFLLEAIYRNDLREELTLSLLEQWKDALQLCDKGLLEGFVPQGNYPFDLSHAWGGTPLYALPKALLGLEIVKPGMKEICLSPSLLGLSMAEVEVLTPYGKIRCLQKEGEKLHLEVPEMIHFSCK